ncbi:uncharacterized protein PV06_02014 [Exophiala oligosperma]|uniref:AB hydrolase-1 domain-containing protein n=2 Tax=Chaetothyriales TaxID=34395 RepID=A0A0D2DTB0_9EURO|nr:uncharacterized protein PV06_02014 [Exophiala oligosperma]KAJ9646185.1 hypothetical protein H2204_000848 [Knufia peltigerae]KIW46338.1 hypothetical protein PV06_02014 [Exophiala oligosperma]
MPLPTVLLVHGAWHSPEHFEPLIAALEARGFKALTASLPSVHYAEQARPPPTELAADVEAIASLARTELDANPQTDIVLLGHSYGSLPASCAVQSLDKPSRRKSGHANGITALFAISGLLLPSGSSPWEMGGRQYPAQMSVSKQMFPDPSGNGPDVEVVFTTPSDPPGPIDLLYHDVEAKEAERYTAMLKPFVFNNHYSVVPCAGYLAVPTFYLLCSDDHALPPAVQEMVVAGANADIEANGGVGNVEITRIHSSHSPFLSRVAETSDWIKASVNQLR